MPETTTLPVPGGLPAAAGSGPEEAAAALAAVTAPLTRIPPAARQLAAAAIAAATAAAGAALAAAARPGAAGSAATAGCALVLALRLTVLPAARRRAQRGAAGWTAAAAVYEESLPGRVPAATMDAIRRWLPRLPRPGAPRPWAYVAPCPGGGRHSVLCRGVMAREPGGTLLLVVGEHAAADPLAVRAGLAHEAGHCAGPARRALAIVHGARDGTGWGWAAAGLLGAAAGGWPGVLAAAAAFQALSLLAAWTLEITCDRRAVRAGGRAVILHGYAVMTACRTADRTTAPARHALAVAAAWLAGPAHPPVRLRAALTRAATRPGPRRHPGTRAPRRRAGDRACRPASGPGGHAAASAVPRHPAPGARPAGGRLVRRGSR